MRHKINNLDIKDTRATLARSREGKKVKRLFVIYQHQKEKAVYYIEQYTVKEIARKHNRSVEMYTNLENAVRYYNGL